MAAFLNGTCNENQLDALVQALFKHIKKYDRSPNMDELRSIVSGLAEQCTNSVSVTDRIELLVRKLCYQFSNQSNRYPGQSKFHQPNKRKRLTRDDDTVINNHQQGRNSNTINDLDRLMHSWTTTNDCKDSNHNENIHHQQHPPSGSSLGSSSPISNHMTTNNHEQSEGCQEHTLDLSTGKNNNNLMFTE